METVEGMRSQENHTVFPVGEQETSEAVSTVELIELIYSWGAIAWWLCFGACGTPMDALEGFWKTSGKR